MAADRARIEARLTAMGLSSILSQLLAGPLSDQINLPLSDLTTAKAVQRLLYGWLTFYPEVKAGVKIRLDLVSGVLLIIPSGLPERRGRKHIY